MPSTQSHKHAINKESPSTAPRRTSQPGPTTFFLSREPTTVTLPSDLAGSDFQPANPLTTLHDVIDDGDRSSKRPKRNDSRRRSTIKPAPDNRSRRTSSATQDETTTVPPARSITPSPIPSQNVSLPSTPKSVSSRSIRRSDEEPTSDDAASQAIASSEDDEAELPTVQDSQPELIMPSIKMPSRRPFTERGKRLGRFKVLVAGQKGSGKTSLIKSIVQVCEDIVHVDPLSSVSSSIINPANRSPKQSLPRHQPTVTETYASTKPYPSWWSDLEESRVLRRRKSVGDAVLERNLCFVDISHSAKLDHVVHYLEQRLLEAQTSIGLNSPSLAGLLSGRGGSQVDVILYLISHDNLKQDQERIQVLSEIANVIPLIARSDLLSLDEQQSIKQQIDPTSSALPRIPACGKALNESANVTQAPYTITSINGPDLDTMDASLLMSPEYVQPLLPSELTLLIDQLFDIDTVAYLKHTASKKLVAWHASHPKLTQAPSSSSPSPQNSTLASPLPISLSNSGVLIPPGGSDLSLTNSNSFALARVADHTQREERLAQIRLSKWASDLQLSLQRERERYERLARNERAVWLIERMGEEVREGQVIPFDNKTTALIQQEHAEKGVALSPSAVYQMHDPLGFLQWRDSMRTRSWLALQVVGSFGVVGSLAFWLAKSWGWTVTLSDWTSEWTQHWFGVNE